MFDTPDGEGFYRVWLSFHDNTITEEYACFDDYRSAREFLSLAVRGVKGCGSGTVRRNTGEIIRTIERDGEWTREW